MRRCRLIVDPPADGAWNMAVDEALLVLAADTGGRSLRFYQWREPTLSLGYFQHIADRASHAASRGCALVRRQTGGGAILHDRELTYSLSLPPQDALARNAERLYREIHQAVIRVLRRSLDGGVFSLAACAIAAPAAEAAEPFLCFKRRSPGDVLLHERGFDSTSKIVGSAQRRWRGAVLQHGSILLQTSPAAPELAGLVDRTGVEIPLEPLIAELSREIEQAIESTLVDPLLPADFAESVRRIAAAKYNAPAWTNRR